ncbi:hypothetical protein ACVRZR_06465 [Streptococcus entericus]|uniref:hypothetical protein n=1 Tax=Streptococcus entericus TaxID=155680 RepID=UPI00036D7D86|nr:hypothetical protein [Streptococcus entericus]
MSVTVVYDFYSEVCENTMYGQHFLELPEEMIDRLDDYFDGLEIPTAGGIHPNNVYVNSYTIENDREVATFWTKLIDEDDYDRLEAQGQLESWLDYHRNEIEERLSDRVYVLGYVSGEWHFLQ